MGTVLPTDKRLLVMFGVSHTIPWTTNKTAIGLSDPQLLDFKTKAGKAQTAFDAAEAARQASKAATDAYYAAVATLRTSAADCVRTIQNKAKSSNDPTIYALAEISPPDPRSHTGTPPAQPTDLRAGLNSDGSITLTWKCSNPRGVARVIYFVKRKLTGEPDFTLVDTVGEKSFTDMNLPFGTQQASYLITGKSGSLTGPTSGQFSVMFGTVAGGGGMTIVSTSEGEHGAVKMAA